MFSLFWWSMGPLISHHHNLPYFQEILLVWTHYFEHSVLKLILLGESFGSLHSCGLNFPEQSLWSTFWSSSLFSSSVEIQLCEPDLGPSYSQPGMPGAEPLPSEWGLGVRGESQTICYFPSTRTQLLHLGGSGAGKCWLPALPHTVNADWQPRRQKAPSSWPLEMELCEADQGRGGHGTI